MADGKRGVAPGSALVVLKVTDAEGVTSSSQIAQAVPGVAEVRSVREVEVWMDHSISIQMLFDAGHSLDERILREQFGF